MDFSKPANARYIWNQVESYWEHRNLPKGQRFLGSVKLTKNSTERILGIAQANLSKLGHISLARLESQFGTEDFTWIKLLTFALAEYAYYDDGEKGYWQGVCDRLRIENCSSTCTALQQVAWQGVKDLGLVRSNKANRYVSTLWLQSGIPQQSLKHFADLIQNLDYDWWDLAHAEPIDLAQLLCDVCEQRFPQRGRLLTFLRSSCSEDSDEEADPISGTLLKGLATVAHELDRRGESPTILQDESQRARILQKYSLPNTFFLRSWDSLVNVLTPRSRHSKKRTIVNQRKKPLSLLLDVTDSFDIQLVLPEQQIYRKEWKTLQAEYCTLPEACWEGDIHLSSGVLQIPELRQAVTEVAEQWTWQLRSHKDSVLLEWHHAGIQPDQLCLIFDADTGELRSPQQLALSSEIVLFTPSDVERTYESTIEIVDSFVPCSLAGWRGHLLQRKATDAQIILCRDKLTQTLVWNQLTHHQPQLQGIRLKGHKQAFLGTPTLWYPPDPISKTLNVLVEDLSRRQTVSQPNQQVHLAASSSWQAVDLSQWVKSTSTYIVRLWNMSHQWSETFKVEADFQLAQAPPGQNLEVLDRQHLSIGEFPILCPTAEDFWLEELTIKGLWPLEELSFEITNGQDKIQISKNASGSGSVLISLASFRDTIPESNQYSLNWFLKDRVHQVMSLNSIGEKWAITNGFQEDAPWKKTEYIEGERSSNNSGSKPSVYWVQWEKRKIRHLQELLSYEIQKEGVREFISLSYDKQLPDYVQIRIEAQRYEPILKTICSSIEQKLHNKIRLVSR